jgi:putative RNA 2'-phosphotransferase
MSTRQADDLKKLSKFLSVMLRHEPTEFGLTLDAQGFTPVDAVWAQVTKRYSGRYQYADLLTVVQGDSSGKKRYEIVNGRIRAMYGHSTGATAIEYVVAVPPEILYHGTNASAATQIRAEGLRALSRQYVHLATNTARAITVGARHEGQTVLLTVRALAAHQAGVAFYHAEAEHYLAQFIPVEFIDG